MGPGGPPGPGWGPGPGGPGWGPGPRGPGQDWGFFGGCFDGICNIITSCLSCLGCCWLLSCCFGGPHPYGPPLPSPL